VIDFDFLEVAFGWIDWASVGIALAALFQFLPQIAALMSIGWTVYRVYSDYHEKRDKNRT
jgi:hypothetical protein